MSDIEHSKTRIGRRDLFERIWSKPMTVNAIELKTTTWVLSALAKRLELPLPPAGHWTKKEVGKEPPTPEYPTNSALDETLYPLAGPRVRLQRAAPVKAAATNASGADSPIEPHEGDIDSSEKAAPVVAQTTIGEHKKVSSTRSAIGKIRSANRSAVGGRGKFRLLVAPSSGDRACAILDRLVAAVEAKGWSLDSVEQGYAILADSETISFMIEEKLDRVPHIVTAAEIKEKADYDRKCALADRGIGYRPWRPPTVPQHDYVPNGELVLKFDHIYAAGGTRRVFSDGKRQCLEDLVPAMLDALERRATALKARREEQARWKLECDEQERHRKDHERQVRVEGYRIAFLQRQIERQREIDGLASLVATWEQAEHVDPKFAELLEFARLYRKWLEAKIDPAAVAERIAQLKLMDDDVYIYDTKRLD